MSLLLVYYSLRNLWVRRLTTALTVAGLSLVVFVFMGVLMLAQGLKTALVTTGSELNAIVLRKGSNTEIASGLYRDQAHILATMTDIALDENGRPLVVPELVVLINLQKKGQTTPTSVTLRGTSLQALTLRTSIRLVAGRPWQPGMTEIIVGAQIASRFEHVKLGETLQFGKREWTVVGIFAAGGSAFESEAWGDAAQLMMAYGRDSFSTATLRLADPSALGRLRTAVEADPRLSLQVKRERDYNTEKSGMMVDFIRFLGLAFTFIFSIGAVLGAAITMYGAVTNRTGEIAMLRTIGFTSPHILTAFLVESLIMAVGGWLFAATCASFLQFVTISTTNWATMSELAFGFALSPRILLQGLLFSLAMGLLGGFFPGLRASRASIAAILPEHIA